MINSQLIPGPNSPAFIQMMHWIINPFHFLETCENKYGDLFVACIGNNLSPIILSSNPNTIEKLFNEELFETPAGELSSTIEPILGKTSILSLSGQKHADRRQLLLPPFHGERMFIYGKLIEKITIEVMEKWTNGNIFLADSVIRDISLQVIIQSVFGFSDGDRYQNLRKLLGEWLNSLSSVIGGALLYLPILQLDLGFISPWGRFLRIRQEIDQLIYEEIADRRERDTVHRTDILSLLMSAQDEVGQKLSDLELRNELVTLLITGHDTTSTAMIWVLYWTYQSNVIKEKLKTELENHVNCADIKELIKLPYLNAVCSETLRIYPPGTITFPRVARRPLTLQGYRIETGTQFMGCVYLSHMRPDIFPNPKEFFPERFLERKYSPYEFFPFGGGDRRCIGMAFAQFQLKVVLATIVSKYNLSIIDPSSIRPVRRGLTAAPSELRMSIVG